MWEITEALFSSSCWKEAQSLNLNYTHYSSDKELILHIIVNYKAACYTALHQTTSTRGALIEVFLADLQSPIFKNPDLPVPILADRNFLLSEMLLIIAKQSPSWQQYSDYC